MTRVLGSPRIRTNPSSYTQVGKETTKYARREKRGVTSLANSFIPGRSAPVRHNPSICRHGVSRVMPLLAACNRVGGKESDSSERTARHWLYVNERKKSHSIRRTFHSSILHPLLLLLLLSAPSRIFLPLSLRLCIFPLHPEPRRPASPFFSLCTDAGASLLIRCGAKLLMPDCTPQDNEEGKEEVDVDGSCDFRKKFSASLGPSPVVPPFLLAVFGSSSSAY